MDIKIVWYKCQECGRLFQSISYFCRKACCDYCRGTGIRVENISDDISDEERREGICY